MAKDDRLTMQEFARRYKVTEKGLEDLCISNDVTPETEVTREEFKQMLDSSPAGRMQDPEPAAKEPAFPKEEPVKDIKTEFARLAEGKGLDRVRIAVLKAGTGWADDTKITEAELEAAVKKHLKNKED